MRTQQVRSGYFWVPLRKSALPVKLCLYDHPYGQAEEKRRKHTIPTYTVSDRGSAAMTGQWGFGPADNVLSGTQSTPFLVHVGHKVHPSSCFLLAFPAETYPLPMAISPVQHDPQHRNLSNVMPTENLAVWSYGTSGCPWSLAALCGL
jgi:hypothetical protein